MCEKRAWTVFRIIHCMHRGLEINIRVTQIYSTAEGFPSHHNTKEQSWSVFLPKWDFLALRWLLVFYSTIGLFDLFQSSCIAASEPDLQEQQHLRTWLNIAKHIKDHCSQLKNDSWPPWSLLYVLTMLWCLAWKTYTKHSGSLGKRGRKIELLSILKTTLSQ